MASITRSVAEIETPDRQALEHVVGMPLRDDPQIIIRVVNRSEQPAHTNGSSSGGQLPDWCNVYEGLSDQEVSDLERVVLVRAELYA